MKKKLLIASHGQFGYNTDYAKYCRYLKGRFDITYLCWDYQKERLKESGISIYYISRKGSIIARNFRFIRSIIQFVKKNKYHRVFMCYFRGCSTIPLLFNHRQNIHLDIRTGKISDNPLKRKTYNTLIRIESKFFRSVSVISESLRSHLKITQEAYILPLGADPIKLEPKIKHKLSLIYVGTFSGRKIENTIKGLAFFLEENPRADVVYTIIGDGSQSEVTLLINLIEKYKLEKHISLEGYILRKDLNTYYEKANAGVAYIPMTSYYDCQPATKIFEYLMAGLPVIATSTSENKQIINNRNGILTDHTIKSFARGISFLYDNIDTFSIKDLESSVSDFKWEKIINEMEDALF